MSFKPMTGEGVRAKPAAAKPTYMGGQPRPGSPEWFAAHGVTRNSAGKIVNSALPGATAAGVVGKGTDAGTTPTAGPPVDPALVAQQNAANLSIGLGDAWDTYKGGQLDASYGNLDNPAADAASNPYSQAALAYKRYNESQAGTNTSYAAGGHLYSGSLQDATEANASNYGQTLAGLRQSKQGAKDALTEGKLSRYSQAGATVNSDTLASLLRSLGL